jgi:cyclin-dependent kinase regulatory subunit CKS1
VKSILTINTNTGKQKSSSTIQTAILIQRRIGCCQTAIGNVIGRKATSERKTLIHFDSQSRIDCDRAASNQSLQLSSVVILIIFVIVFSIFERRHVVITKNKAKLVPKNHLMSETEWRSLGVHQSHGWIHYMMHEPEPHILLFRRPLKSPGPSQIEQFQAEQQA